VYHQYGKNKNNENAILNTPINMKGIIIVPITISDTNFVSI
jgi:hypothetical protein